MCGILVFNGADPIDFYSGLESIRHRGPNSQGSKTFTYENDRQLVLGHVRLSIIDVDKRSDQPFTIDHENFLVYNGEIYNYLELQQKYLGDFVMRTSSDTEVLWYLLKYCGIKILSELIGMFALSFYNSKTGELLTTRDSLGIKPLYFLPLKNDGFIIASEIKAMRALGYPVIVDPNDVAEYMQFGYLHEPRTGFQNIIKIEPGQIRIDRTFEKQTRIEKIIIAKPAQPTELKHVIQNSIKMHERADVRQALFFSGGVDSSILLCNMNTSHIIPILWSTDRNITNKSGFTSDSYYAKWILKDQNIPYLEFENDSCADNLLSDIDYIVKGVEELISDYTFVASGKLSGFASKKNFKVVHSGMGADEVFGGYPRYLAFKIVKRFRFLLRLFLPILTNIKSKKSGRLISAIKAKNDYDTYFSLIGPFEAGELDLMLGQDSRDYLANLKRQLWSASQSSSSLKTAINVDLKGFLSHNFIVADKSSMISSVEMRVPLVTQETLLWAKSARERDLIRGFELKSALRKVLFASLDRKYFRRKKAGFNPPLDGMIRDIGQNEILRILELGKISQYIEWHVCRDIVMRHFSKQENNTYKIYNLLFLSKWIDYNVCCADQP